MTIAMLSLAGFPATVGFFGKLYLIQAAVDNEYAWLGVVIVLGSAISLVYYLRVIAAVWMRPASDAGRAGGRARRRAARDGRRLARGRRRAAPAARRRAGRRDGDAVEVERRGRGRAPGRRLRQPEVVFVAVVCALATVAFGIWPEPLFDLARDAGAAIASLV